MQSERWQSCTEIFHAALECAPDERAAFLERRCANDRALREKVELLIRYHEEAGDFIASSALAAARELFADDPGALIGQHLGSYRIDAVLGVGGMGVVYLAYDERLERKVGLKLLPPALVRNAAQLERLKFEARTASALNHPNIVTVHEIGQVDSIHYIAIEFIEGITLRERIARGPIPPEETLGVTVQVASALCVAHRAGIVHRDIKPENIMIRPDGYVKVLDFGIAKSIPGEAAAGAASPVWQTDTQTRLGVVLGTMRYMSPEQTKGENVDARSDIWSLGVVLHEMLTGRAPFDGKTPAQVRAALLERQPPPLGDRVISPPVQNIVAKCLRKNPAERFQAAEELLGALRANSGQGGSRRSRGWAALGIAGLIFCAMAVAFFMKPRANDPSHKSIAVLPFADLSPAHDQQFFSDGMAEEILNALAHVKDLKVAGRSSSFSFRGKDEDLRTIGSTLGVAHILEGSVRKQDDKVRITAQLIQVSDGFHLWSETYDAELDDVFSLQERIARAITEQLAVVLQGEQKSRLVKTATTNMEAYALYLQATAIFNRRERAHFTDAIAQLRQAVRLDPSFARAHARLASLSSIAPQYDVHLQENASDIVAREARLASELDPTLAEPHAALGQTLFTQRRFGEARTAYARALEIDPDDFAANFWLGTLLSSTGYAQASAEMLDKVLTKDPMLPNALLWRGWVHLQLGEIDQAERSIRRAAEAGLSSVGLAFAHVARAHNENTPLVDWLGRGLEPFMSDLPAGTSRVIAAGTIGSPAERTEAISVIERYLATQPGVISGAIPLALIWLGEPERALALAQASPTRNDTLFLPSLWTAAGSKARSLPQFAAFAQKTGLAEFWDKSGPPDLCRKQENGDYVCEKAAEKNTLAGGFALSQPTGVALHAEGTMDVADFARHTIRRMKADDVMRDFAGQPGETGSADGLGAFARFNHPADVAIDRDENIYVADTDNHLIRKITPAGLVTTLAGRAGEAGTADGPASSARFNYPTGLTLDDGGNVYVADFANHTVRKITPAGIVTTLGGSAGKPGSADGAGDAARFKQVHDVAVDLAGNVYAADFGNHTIRKITPSGDVSTLAGLAENPGSADGAGRVARFCAPYSVAVDDASNVFVADTSNHTIRKIRPGGEVTTLAGLAGNVGSGDGAGTEARFAVPSGLTLDKAGNIYVADFGNRAIRKITPAAEVSTVVGLGGGPDAAR